MTFKDLQDRVMAFGYGESDRTWIKTWLNMAYADVATRRRWSWLERSTTVTTVAGQQTVTIPTPVGALVAFWGRLKPTTESTPVLSFSGEMSQNVDSPVRTLHATAPPRTYSLWNNQAVFYPTPDRAYTYTLRYWTLPVDMELDADIPLIPAGYHNVLVLGALMYAAERDHNGGLYAQRQAAYEAQIQRLVAQETLRQAESPTKVPMPDHYGGIFDV